MVNQNFGVIFPKVWTLGIIKFEPRNYTNTLKTYKAKYCSLPLT